RCGRVGGILCCVEDLPTNERHGDPFGVGRFFHLFPGALPPAIEYEPFGLRTCELRPDPTLRPPRSLCDLCVPQLRVPHWCSRAIHPQPPPSLILHLEVVTRRFNSAPPLPLDALRTHARDDPQVLAAPAHVQNRAVGRH